MSFNNNLDQLYRSVIMDHYKNPRNKGSLDENSVTIDMNNPTCGDRIHLTLNLQDGVVQDAKFDGEGCSISMSSASMMTQIVKGKKLDEALELAEIFSKMMLGEEFDTEKYDLGDVEALQGVAKFPARIKCATLAWKAMEKGVQNEK
jgi:nitrogen fixation protein NifU and related proteins